MSVYVVFQEQYYGVVKWIGYLPPSQLLDGDIQDRKGLSSNNTMIAGIELVSTLIQPGSIGYFTARKKYLYTRIYIRCIYFQEDEIDGGLNGWHHGSQLFECGEGRGVFLPFTHFQPDRRFEPTISQVPAKDVSAVELSTHFSNTPTAPLCLDTSNNGEDLDFGGIECPTVPGFEQPIQDFLALLGRNRGIQGHQNSCYLDATLFAMFSFTR